MLHRVWLLCAVLLSVVFFYDSAAAFDNHRQGFVLGGGLGFAPTARFSYSGRAATNKGLAAQFIIGYAWNDRNMIVFEGNAMGRPHGNSPLIDTLSRARYGSEWPSLAQGFNGAVWYHYFRPYDKGAFVASGMGVYILRSEWVTGSKPGFGALLGVGYVMTPHWQIGGYLAFGGTRKYYNHYGHNHFSVLVSGIAF